MSEPQFNKQDSVTHKQREVDAELDAATHKITALIAGIRGDYETQAHNDFVQYSKEVDAHIKTKGWLITLIIVLCVETALVCALIRHVADLIGQQS